MSILRQESDPKSDKNVGVISMQDFLQFLKISSRVSDSIEKNSKLEAPFSYQQLAKNELVNGLSIRKYRNISTENSSTSLKATEPPPAAIKDDESTKRRKKSGKTLTRNVSLKSKLSDNCDSILYPNLNPVLTEKLDEVLNQGIFDSFLPFICNQPNLPSTATTASKTEPVHLPKNSSTPSLPAAAANPSSHLNNAAGNTSISNLVKTKQLLSSQKSASLDRRLSSSFDHANSFAYGQKNAAGRKRSPIVIENLRTVEPELTIHVCDEVKGVSKDFTCPQKLLISKMGYFADITSGQKLEDLDISVHCDLEIFNWLINWVKRETFASQENWPKLNASNVIPILVSASFLQMESLLNECLSFCHANLSEVVKVSPNLGCLNDTIITRLAAMFTNLELESVKDKKDRIQPRLFCKLIQSLCESEAQSIRGHFATLAGLFRCMKCGKCMTQSVSSYVHCLPQNMRLNRWGQVMSSHVRDVNWSLSNYVANLYKELRSWRKVYWRLWATCHFLFCSICETHFPASQMQWCLYHPDLPQYVAGPQEGTKIGRFPCCGAQQAYRYESITSPYSGCQYRDHCVVAENDRDRQILSLVNQVAENNMMMFEAPPAKLAAAHISTDSWWSGLSILSNRSRQGLLPALHVGDDVKFQRKYRPSTTSRLSDSSSDESESSDYTLQAFRQTSSSSSDGEESECSPARIIGQPNKKRVRTGYRTWSKNLSARSNQDNQREFEERAMKQVVSLVAKKTGISDASNQIYQQGGAYVKLELEWRENHMKHRSVNTKSAKATKLPLNNN